MELLYLERVNIALTHGDIDTLFDLWEESLSLGKTGQRARKAIDNLSSEVAKMNGLPTVSTFRELVKLYDDRDKARLQNLLSTGNTGELVEILKEEKGKKYARFLIQLLKEFGALSGYDLGILAYYILALTHDEAFRDEFLMFPVRFLTANYRQRIIKNKLREQNHRNDSAVRVVTARVDKFSNLIQNDIGIDCFHYFYEEALKNGDVDTILFLLEDYSVNDSKYAESFFVEDTEITRPPVDRMAKTIAILRDTRSAEEALNLLAEYDLDKAKLLETILNSHLRERINGLREHEDESYRELLRKYRFGRFLTAFDAEDTEMMEKYFTTKVYDYIVAEEIPLSKLALLSYVALQAADDATYLYTLSEEAKDMVLDMIIDDGNKSAARLVFEDDETTRQLLLTHFPDLDKPNRSLTRQRRRGSGRPLVK